MAVPSCKWDTLQNWADLAAQDVEFFQAFVSKMGATYARRCTDGTWLITEDMFYAIQNVP